MKSSAFNIAMKVSKVSVQGSVTFSESSDDLVGQNEPYVSPFQQQGVHGQIELIAGQIGNDLIQITQYNKVEESASSGLPTEREENDKEENDIDIEDVDELSENPLIWHHPLGEASLPEVANSVSVDSGPGVPWYRTLASYCGPGALVAVG